MKSAGAALRAVLILFAVIAGIACVIKAPENRPDKAYRPSRQAARAASRLCRAASAGTEYGSLPCPHFCGGDSDLPRKRPHTRPARQPVKKRPCWALSGIFAQGLFRGRSPAGAARKAFRPRSFKRRPPLRAAPARAGYTMAVLTGAICTRVREKVSATYRPG